MYTQFINFDKKNMIPNRSDQFLKLFKPCYVYFCTVS